MRLAVRCGDHAVQMTGLPAGMSAEAVADFLRLLRNEVVALYTATETADTEVPPELDG